MPTGDIEVKVSDVVLHSMADVLPIQVFGEDNSPEELRLKYRFLDLRREKSTTTSFCAAKLSNACAS